MLSRYHLFHRITGKVQILCSLNSLRSRAVALIPLPRPLRFKVVSVVAVRTGLFGTSPVLAPIKVNTMIFAHGTIISQVEPSSATALNAGVYPNS